MLKLIFARMDFSKEIAVWYRANKRELPWRNVRDPYLIWLSEIILQQTRVEQGLPYYLRFTEKYPTVSHLAKAKEGEVMKLWQGLGYYSRARNLHATAKHIAFELNGKFPATHREILGLKGVGAYTAAAIASFAYGEAQAVVDGNVYRLLSRYFGVKTPIDSGKGKKQFLELAASLLDRNDPGTHNQAIMEFGARQCVPKNPACGVCPLGNSCFAKAKNKVNALPVKEKKTKTSERHFHYFLLRHRGHVWINHRSGKDIWKGLYDLPLIESAKAEKTEKIFASKLFRGIIGNKKFTVKNVSPVFRHVLSHQNIYATFVEIEVSAAVPGKNLLRIKENSLHKYAVPRLIDRYLESRKRYG